MVNKRKMETSPGIQDGKKEKTEPRLCNLPTDILCSILSLLPFKEAVRTSILSTQWKNLWCWCDKLDFSYDTEMSKNDRMRCFSSKGCRINKQKFVSTVNVTLYQHRGLGIKQFRVDYALHKEDAKNIDRWVKHVMRLKAKELVLWFPRSEYGPRIVPYDFPLQIINTKNNMHLRSLHLMFCLFEATYWFHMLFGPY